MDSSVGNEYKEVFTTTQEHSITANCDDTNAVLYDRSITIIFIVFTLPIALTQALVILPVIRVVSLA